MDERCFTKYDWYNFYRDAKEAIPGNCPPERGNPVSTHCFVDANLTGDSVTRRSQSGILIFVNKAQVMWHSKLQNIVETSTFGSEIMAMKNAVELIEGLCLVSPLSGQQISIVTMKQCIRIVQFLSPR